MGRRERTTYLNCRLWRLTAALVAVLVSSPLAAQPADLEAWTTTRSQNFTILSDAEPQRVAEIALGLERFRAAFARLAPDLELRSPAPTRMFAFRDADSYAPYKTTRDAKEVKILGQFLSHRDGNYITLNADPKFLGSVAVIYHEYVHYLVQHNFPGVPRWFNEGLAEYYSTFEVDSTSAFVGRPVPRHLRWLASNAELGLGEVLGLDGEPALAYDAQKAGRFYAVSWGLVHYLFSGDAERVDRTADFLAYLTEGIEPLDALEAAFGLRLDELEDRLSKYLLGNEFPVASIPLARLRAAGEVEIRPTHGPDLLSQLGDLVAHMSLEAEAEWHFQAALGLDPEHAEALIGLGYVRDAQNRLNEADVLFEQGLGLGSSEALSYLLYGRHQLSVLRVGGLEPESDPVALVSSARDAFAAAVELDPGYAEARAMLGYMHLFGDLDPRDGIAHLEEARRLLPARKDLVFHLMQLHLRADRPDQAEALVEADLARRGDDEMVARAREEIRRWRLIQEANRALKGGEFVLGLRLYDEAISVTSDPDLRSEMESNLRSLQQRFDGR